MPEVKPANMLLIDPTENILIGHQQIQQYMHIKSINTLYQWVELYGFPAIKRPDGLWMSSMTSIDQWIFLAAELDSENRPYSRGYSQKLEIAKIRLENRIEHTKALTQAGQKRKSGPITIPGVAEGFAAKIAAEPELAAELKRTAATRTKA